MHGPPTRLRRTSLSTALCSLAVFVTLFVSIDPVAAQTQPTPEVLTGLSYISQIVGAVLSTLVIGGGFVLLAPEYTERTTDRMQEKPLEAFLFGLGISILAFFVAFLLAITIVGIVLVIPMVIAGIILGELGYLGAGRTVTDELTHALVAAAVVAAFVGGVPILGGLLGFVLSCMGIGAWFLEYRADDESDPGGSEFGPSGTGPGGSTAGEDVTDEWGSGRSGGQTSGSQSNDGTTGRGDGGTGDGDEWTAGFDDGNAR